MMAFSSSSSPSSDDSKSKTFIKGEKCENGAFSLIGEAPTTAALDTPYSVFMWWPSLQFLQVSPLNSFTLKRKAALLSIKLSCFFAENAQPHENKSMVNVSEGSAEKQTEVMDS